MNFTPINLFILALMFTPFLSFGFNPKPDPTNDNWQIVETETGQQIVKPTNGGWLVKGKHGQPIFFFIPDETVDKVRNLPEIASKNPNDLK